MGVAWPRPAVLQTGPAERTPRTQSFTGEAQVGVNTADPLGSSELMSNCRPCTRCAGQNVLGFAVVGNNVKMSVA